MKTYLFFLLVVVLHGCGGGDASSTKPKQKGYDEIVEEQLALGSRNDTTFLGFVLGMPEVDAERYLKGLVKNGELGSESTWELLGGAARIGGYPYKLQLNDTTSCDCIFSPTYFVGELYFLTLLVIKCPSNEVKDFLKRVYGEPNIKKDDGLFWIKGNRELEHKIVAGMDALEFRDLRIKKEHLKLNATIDSFTREFGGKDAKKTEGDFK